MPVPVTFNFCFCDPLLVLSTTMMNSLKSPLAVGVNVTLMTQLFPGANVAGQFEARLKGRFAAMLVIVRFAVPMLVNVEVCGTASVPTMVLGK